MDAEAAEASWNGRGHAMYKMRFSFSKRAPASYISHLDLMKVLQRGLKRAGAPVKYSEGFNPHIVMSIPAPLSTGFEGMREICDFEITQDIQPSIIKDMLRDVMPQGIIVTGAWHPVLAVSRIRDSVFGIKYNKVDANAAMELLQKPYLLEKRTKRGTREIDLCGFIRDLSFSSMDGKDVLIATIKAGTDALNPRYISQALQQEGIVDKVECPDYIRLDILDDTGKSFL